MSIFVQWKWKEQTKSFLVIFHFYDDFSKPNLRIKEKNHPHIEHLFPKETKVYMTWAASHIELGQLAELLRYANIIDGLDEYDKRELRDFLEGESNECVYELVNELGDKSVFWYVDPDTDEYIFCVEICVEYIDYLKQLLKPYTS